MARDCVLLTCARRPDSDSPFVRAQSSDHPCTAAILVLHHASLLHADARRWPWSKGVTSSCKRQLWLMGCLRGSKADIPLQVGVSSETSCDMASSGKVAGLNSCRLYTAVS